MDKHDLSTPYQILQEALAREIEAREFYSELAARCHVDFVRELLERLKDEESKHLRLVQNMITRLNLGKDVV